MRKMVIVVLALALIVALVVPVIARWDDWRELAAGGKWHGDRETKDPASGADPVQNRYRHGAPPG